MLRVRLIGYIGSHGVSVASYSLAAVAQENPLSSPHGQAHTASEHSAQCAGEARARRKVMVDEHSAQCAGEARARRMVASWLTSTRRSAKAKPARAAWLCLGCIMRTGCIEGRNATTIDHVPADM